MNGNNERVLRSATVQVERKTIDLELRENGRGQFLKIKETSDRGRSDMVAIPSSGLREVVEAIRGLMVNHRGAEGAETGIRN